MGIRQEKINEQTQRELNEIIRSVKDYRITSVLFNITAARVSKDLSVAKIYYSALPTGKNAVDIKEINKGLVSANGYIRSELAKRLNLRITPKLTFEFDNTVEKAMHIEKVLKEIDDESINKQNS
ncbi:MAG: ribosome-binding factor A [Clostridiales bacterium GWF2_38_85]|nr:MAG: ribosome-binding factor A [Clostridiales bacterium GWF2_38_85]HBL85313.1 30S ribosome-binding factor RbfA [Clostridiales bacterium]